MIVHYENQTVTLPDFLLIGAAKSGTTSLFEYLNQHPEVFVPAKKELFYFSFGNKKPTYTNSNFLSMLTWKRVDYIEEFQNTKGKIIGECSTSYLYTSSETIANIKELYGEQAKDLKIMVILRNPVDRAFSHYTHLVRNGLETLSFEEAIHAENISKRKNEIWGFDYIEYGNYGTQLSNFIQEFPQTKVFLFEDLKMPENLLLELQAFLKLQTPFSASKIESFNPSGIPKHKRTLNLLRDRKIKRVLKWFTPKKLSFKLKSTRDQWMAKTMTRIQMKPETKQMLIAQYSEEIDKLAQLIQRPLNHWKEWH